MTTSRRFSRKHFAYWANWAGDTFSYPRAVQFWRWGLSLWHSRTWWQSVASQEEMPEDSKVRGDFTCVCEHPFVQNDLFWAADRKPVSACPCGVPTACLWGTCLWRHWETWIWKATPQGSNSYLAIAGCFLRGNKGDATEVSQIRRIILRSKKLWWSVFGQGLTGNDWA